MALERDHAAERLARIDFQLTEAKRTMHGLKPTDRSGVRELATKLDEWLKELRGTKDRSAS